MDTSLKWKPLKVYNTDCSELYDYSDTYNVSNTGIVYNYRRKRVDFY